MAQSGMRAMLDAAAKGQVLRLGGENGHIEPVDVPGVPQSRGVAILVRFGNEPHHDISIQRVDQRVRMPAIRNPEHDRVDLFRLGVIAADRSVREIRARRENHLRTDRARRKFARERGGDVGVVGVPAR